MSARAGTLSRRRRRRGCSFASRSEAGEICGLRSHFSSGNNLLSFSPSLTLLDHSSPLVADYLSVSHSLLPSRAHSHTFFTCLPTSFSFFMIITAAKQVHCLSGLMCACRPCSNRRAICGTEINADLTLSLSLSHSEFYALVVRLSIMQNLRPF